MCTQTVAGAGFRYVDFRCKWPVGRIAKCFLQYCVVLVCKARRPVDFLHSGDLHALDMRYLPWCVRSRSLLQCRRSSSRVCRGAASRGCLECSTSRRVRAESGSSVQVCACVKCCHTLLSRNEMYIFVWRCFEGCACRDRISVGVLC